LKIRKGTENIAGKKKGKRQYLNIKLTRDLMKKLELVFESSVEISRIKVVRNRLLRP